MKKTTVRVLSILFAVVLLCGAAPLAAVRATAAAPLLASGGFHSIALRPNDTVWTWGYNYAGQLGDGTTRNRTTPVVVPGLSGVIAAAAGYGHSIALKADGTVWTWGDNRDGQLGLGDTRDRRTPTQVPGLTDVIAVEACDFNTIALKSDGTVWAWGVIYADIYAETSNIPVQLEISDVTAIAAKNSDTLALKSDGTVWAWGYYASDSYRRFYDITIDRETPVQIANLTDVTAIATGGYHNFAWKSDGTVWGWGSNSWGELGFDSETIECIMPVEVPALSGAAAIAANSVSTFVLKPDGTVWVCGVSNFGARVGDGTLEYQSTPMQVPGLSGITAVAAGFAFAAALQADGTIWCWGDNAFGQLGDGTTFDSSYPVQIVGPSEMTLPEGYEATATESYKVIGSRTISAASNTPEITWDDGGMRLEIAEGLPVGNYTATLKASDGEGHNATSTFTLTVVPPHFWDSWPPVLQWILQYILFGWLWMRWF